MKFNIVVDCTPDEVRFRFLTTKEGAPEDLLATYEVRLQASDHLRVSSGHVRFVVALSVQP